MQNIQIDRKLKEKWNQAVLGCIQCSVEVTDSPKELLGEIEEVSQQLISSMQIEDIKSREHIAQTRACCKALGKDVKRYRNSAEAMNRRILQGKGLYHINNVVEVNNLISVKTGYSLGTYDATRNTAIIASSIILTSFIRIVFLITLICTIRRSIYARH